MDEVSAAQQQDIWRSARQFISGLNTALGNTDQAWSGQDSMVGNPTGQFRTVGPYSTSVEGLPITTSRNGGIVISPALVLVGAGVALALLWKH